MPNASSGRRRPAAYDSSSSDPVSEEDRFDDGEDEGKARVPVREKATRTGKAARASSGGGFFSQVLMNQSEDRPTSPQQATTAKSSTSKATTTRKRQSKITDSPTIKKAASSKPATSTKHVVIDLGSDTEEESLFTPKKAANASSKFTTTSQKKQSKITDSPALKKAASSKASTSSKHTLINLDSDDEEESLSTAKKASNKPSKFATSQKKQSKIVDAPALKKAAASKLATSSQPSKPAVIDVDSDSEGPSLFTPKKDRSSASTKQASTDDTDSDAVILPSNRRSAVKSATARGTKRAASTDDTDSDGVILPVKKRGAMKRPVPMDTDDSDVEIQPATRPVPAEEASARNSTKRAAPTDSESDAVVRPVKRGRFVRKESNTSGTASEAEPRGTTPPRSSLAKTPSSRRRKDPKSEKKRQMELLRRRRAGETINEEDLTSEEEEEQGALYDSDSDHLALSTFEDDDEGVPGDSSPAKKASKKKLVNGKGKGKAVLSDIDESEKAEDSDDGFVVDDPEGEIGIPDQDIPIELTGYGHAPLKYYFNFAIEWIILSKIHPTFPERQAPVYRMAWNKLNDGIGGLVYSKFISPSWKPGFVHALKARPELFTMEKEASFFPDDKCMACERGGHPSSWVFTFSGSAYYKNSSSPRFLEDVPFDSDDEDDSDGEAEGERDEDNNLLPPASKQWNLGSTCQSNAETAHVLIHWKWSLASWVHERLETQGYLSPEKIAEREEMDEEKKEKVVAEIMEKWQEGADKRKSMMDSLFVEFKRQREQAINKSTTGTRGGTWAR